MEDAVTPEGITQREAVGFRAMDGLARLVEAHKAGTLDFAAAHCAITVLIEAMLPFVDHESFQVMNMVAKHWQDEAAARREADRQLAAAEMDDFGAWGGKPARKRAK